MSAGHQYSPGVHRSRTTWHLGMPHTISRALSEVALLKQAAHFQWNVIGQLTGCPASRQVDADGREVYASIYFVDLAGFPDDGLGAFGPDETLEVVSTLGRYGASMLDAEHRLYAAGTVPDVLPDQLSAAPRVRLSNVLVGVGKGADDLCITTPCNARFDTIPSLPEEPDSYRVIKDAQRRGSFFAAPADARALLPGGYRVRCPIDPDRDLNGVGLLYFASYVAYMDLAERTALETAAGFAPEALDGRVTVARRIGYYGNARPHDTLVVEVEAFVLDEPPGRLLLHHRVTRTSDGRSIAVASAVKRLRVA